MTSDQAQTLKHMWSSFSESTKGAAQNLSIPYVYDRCFLKKSPSRHKKAAMQTASPPFPFFTAKLCPEVPPFSKGGQGGFRTPAQATGESDTRQRLPPSSMRSPPSPSAHPASASTRHPGSSSPSRNPSCNHRAAPPGSAPTLLHQSDTC